MGLPTTLVPHPSCGRLLPLLEARVRTTTGIPLVTGILEAVVEALVLSLPGVAAVLDPAAQSGEERAPPAGGTDLPEEKGVRVAEEAEERGVRVAEEAITEGIGVRVAEEANARVSMVDRTLMAGIIPPL